ncbi:MAG TPA: HPP family protein [Trinickia sp.]|jgi:CBS domain-containing membrane protein|uniref:HPP family protein n=1 Tax=Trinickia sp. TaxID=2571163 RepID=UPI002BE7A28B|nr:HPP family protein [Trinickia sp.]HTI18474.1 HPP family protein [Trinickia sp.]
MSRSAISRWLLSFVPGPITVRWPERFRACLGALLGIAFTGGATHLLLGPSVGIPLLVAPMGASAVLLFGVPASPLAQPWAIVGGNLIAAVIGVACASWFASPVIAGAIAVAVAICAMFALRCVHPPSGAVALTAVLGGPAIHAMGYRFVLAPVAIQTAALVVAAIVFHAVTGHRYPHAGRQSADKGAAPAATSLGFTHADLEAVLRRRSELLDIDPADLESLLRETQLQAYARSFSELTCADIMSRLPIAVSTTTKAKVARDVLERLGVTALAVTDETSRVVGIVTRKDLVIKGPARKPGALADYWRRLFSGHSALSTDTVGALMTTDVFTADLTQRIVELVPVFTNHGHHLIPVLDASRRLVGMITQLDLISGLYRQTHTPRKLVE